jgi:hypothetical protein
VGKGTTLLSNALSKLPDGSANEADMQPIDPVLAATDTMAEFRRVSALVVDEIAAWADVLHSAA